MRKNGKDKTSRGYCGWYKNWEDKNIYLRSRLEYIVAKWLDINKLSYNTEEYIYKHYKPDFFIYINKKLKYIIEVKYSKYDAIKYYKKHKDYFNNLGIRYIVFDKTFISKIKRKYNLHNNINNWIKKCINTQGNVKGKNNPHYGFTHSKESKKLIGNKTKERFKNIDFRKKHSKAVSESMTVERRLKISKITKKRFESIKARNNLSKKLRKYNRVLKIKICKNCNKKFEVYDLYDKNTKEYLKTISTLNSWNIVKGEFCYTGCAIKYNSKIERKLKRDKQIELYYKFVREYNKNPLRKEFKEYCKKFNVSGDIRTSFGTFTKFIKIINKEKI